MLKLFSGKIYTISQCIHLLILNTWLSMSLVYIILYFVVKGYKDMLLYSKIFTRIACKMAKISALDVLQEEKPKT